MEDAPGVLASVDMAFEPPPSIARDVRIPLFLLVLERSGMSMIREANLCESVVLLSMLANSSINNDRGMFL